MHPNAHCNIVYNNQDFKQPKCPSTDQWKRECGIYNNGILLSHRKE